MKSVLTLLVSLSLIGQSLAQTVVIHEQVNARSSANFTNRKNIAGIVPKGSTGEIIERKELPSGNTAIKVRLTSLGDELVSNLKVPTEVWLYYHADARSRVIELYDQKNEKVESPAQAKTAKAKKSFTFNLLIQDEKKTEECVVQNNAAIKPSSLLDQITCLQTEALKNVENVDPVEQEIVAYIKKVRPITSSDNKKRASIEREYQAIASHVVEYAAEEGVPISMALAVMQKESEFYSKAVGRSVRVKKKTKAGTKITYQNAKGLMQLMPDTARSLNNNKTVVNRLDVETNTRLGIKYLGELLWPNGYDAEKALKPTPRQIERALFQYYSGKTYAGKRVPSSIQSYADKVKGYIRSYRNFIADLRSDNQTASTD